MFYNCKIPLKIENITNWKRKKKTQNHDKQHNLLLDIVTMKMTSL